MKNIYERKNKDGETKYCVMMWINKRQTWLGSFDAIADALRVRDFARKEHPLKRPAMSTEEKISRAEAKIEELKSCE